jgi:hypothetical protein
MKFLTNKNQVAEVFLGLGGMTAGEYMAGIRTGLGFSHRRIKSPYLSPKDSFSAAEKDLREYAAKRKWALFEDIDSEED